MPASAVDAAYDDPRPVPPPPPPAAPAAAAAAAPPGKAGRQWTWDGWDSTVDHQYWDASGNLAGYWVHRTRLNTTSYENWHYLTADQHAAAFPTAKAGTYGKGGKDKDVRPGPYQGAGKGAAPAEGRQPQWPDRPAVVWPTNPPAPPAPPAAKAKPKADWRNDHRRGWHGGQAGRHHQDRDRWW